MFTAILDANAVEIKGEAFIQYALGFQHENFYGVHNVYNTIYRYEGGEVVFLYRLNKTSQGAKVTNVVTGDVVELADVSLGYSVMGSLFNGFRWEWVVAMHAQQEVA